MNLLVYMRDGRTVYLITGRKELAKLVNREPFHEETSSLCARGLWNPLTGEYIWTQGIRLRFIAKGSIGVIEEGSWADAQAPA